jgi:two-component system NtrC family sensor kinase
VNTLTGLVRNLKGFARLDRDGVDEIDLNDSIKSSLAVVAHLMRDRVKVVERLAPLPKVHGMPSQINQVVLNLLTNAAQAIEDTGTVTVASRVVDDHHVEISVADTGSGIPQDVLPKIFDPFFTTKAVGEGTGLGLSIAHKIVKSHGGTISVKTDEGRGTTFTVTLPTDSLELPTAQAA